MQILTIILTVAILVMGFYYMRLLPDTKPGEYILLGILITYTWSLIADIDLAIQSVDMLGALSSYPTRGVIYKIPMAVGLGFAIKARLKEGNQLGNTNQYIDRNSNPRVGRSDNRNIHGVDKVFGNAAKVKRA